MKVSVPRAAPSSSLSLTRTAGFIHLLRRPPGPGRHGLSSNDAQANQQMQQAGQAQQNQQNQQMQQDQQNQQAQQGQQAQQDQQMQQVQAAVMQTLSSQSSTLKDKIGTVCPDLDKGCSSTLTTLLTAIKDGATSRDVHKIQAGATAFKKGIKSNPTCGKNISACVLKIKGAAGPGLASPPTLPPLSA